MRRWHRAAGLAMLAPLLVWIITGAIFHLKPGYADAYDLPAIAALPLESPPPAPPLPPGTRELRVVRTVLGLHFLAKTEEGFQQLDPVTGAPRPLPEPAALVSLLNQALEANPARYGEVRAEQLSSEGETVSATTSTGVALRLRWGSLSLSQRGPDTERIDWYYRLHYLQWTGVETIDHVLAVVGLLLLLSLAGTGLRLFLARPAKRG